MRPTGLLVASETGRKSGSRHCRTCRNLPIAGKAWGKKLRQVAGFLARVIDHRAMNENKYPRVSYIDIQRLVRSSDSFSGSGAEGRTDISDLLKLMNIRNSAR